MTDLFGRSGVRLCARHTSPLARGAEQPAAENYPRVTRRAWDGVSYTQEQFRLYYGSYVGDALWQKAIAPPRRRGAKPHFA